MSFVVNKNLCKGCAACIDSCPQNAIFMEGNIARINKNKCSNCGICTDKCPVNAIQEVETAISSPNRSSIIPKEKETLKTKDSSSKLGKALSFIGEIVNLAEGLISQSQSRRMVGQNERRPGNYTSGRGKNRKSGRSFRRERRKMGKRRGNFGNRKH